MMVENTKLIYEWGEGIQYFFGRKTCIACDREVAFSLFPDKTNFRHVMLIWVKNLSLETGK